MIFISQENIVECEVDAIVNAANTRLAGGGGVDGAIHQAAGKDLYEVCAKIGYCGVGKAVITPGFNLKAKYIIHTVGPFYSVFEKEENKTLLANCYINSLDLAMKNDIHSIAFPCISSGVYSYPIEDSSVIAFNTVKTWIDEHEDYDIDVHLVCYTDEEYEAYANVVGEQEDYEEDQEDYEEEQEDVEEDYEEEQEDVEENEEDS